MVFVTYLDEKIRIMLVEARCYDMEDGYANQLPWTSPSWGDYARAQKETGISFNGAIPPQGKLWR